MAQFQPRRLETYSDRIAYSLVIKILCFKFFYTLLSIQYIVLQLLGLEGDHFSTFFFKCHSNRQKTFELLSGMRVLQEQRAVRDVLHEPQPAGREWTHPMPNSAGSHMPTVWGDGRSGAHSEILPQEH